MILQSDNETFASFISQTVVHDVTVGKLWYFVYIDANLKKLLLIPLYFENGS